MKRTTPGLIARTDVYHDEFVKWVFSFKHQDILQFIETHKEEFPLLANPNMHFRLSSRPYFDKYVYSLRCRKFPVEELPTDKGDMF